MRARLVGSGRLHVPRFCLGRKKKKNERSANPATSPGAIRSPPWARGNVSGPQCARPFRLGQGCRGETLSETPRLKQGSVGTPAFAGRLLHGRNAAAKAMDKCSRADRRLGMPNPFGEVPKPTKYRAVLPAIWSYPPSPAPIMPFHLQRVYAFSAFSLRTLAGVPKRHGAHLPTPDVTHRHHA